MRSAAIHKSALRCPKPIRPSPYLATSSSFPPLVRMGPASLPSQEELEVNSPQSQGLQCSLQKGENRIGLEELAQIENELRQRSQAKGECRRVFAGGLCRPVNPMVKDRVWNDLDEKLSSSTDGDSDDEYIV